MASAASPPGRPPRFRASGSFCLWACWLSFLMTEDDDGRRPTTWPTHLSTGEKEGRHLPRWCPVCVRLWRCVRQPCKACDGGSGSSRVGCWLILSQSGFHILAACLLEDLRRTEPVGMERLHNGGGCVCWGVPPAAVASEEAGAAMRVSVGPSSVSWKLRLPA